MHRGGGGDEAHQQITDFRQRFGAQSPQAATSTGDMISITSHTQCDAHHGFSSRTIRNGQIVTGLTVAAIALA